MRRPRFVSFWDMTWFVLALLAQEWSPLRSYDQAAHDFFSTSTAERLGAKLDVWDVDAQGFDLDLALFPKIGVGPYRGDLTDVAVAGVATFPFGNADLHVHAGASWPSPPDVIRAREPEVHAASFSFVGAGLAWDVGDAVRLGFQMELNTAAFREADLLKRHPASAVFGVHARWGRARLDAGWALGVDRLEGWPWMAFVGLSVSF